MLFHVRDDLCARNGMKPSTFENSALTVIVGKRAEGFRIRNYEIYPYCITGT